MQKTLEKIGINGNAIKSLKGILSSNHKEDAGWFIPLKGPPQSTKYKPVLNYILVGNRYLVSEKWQFNHEISKEKARSAIRKSKTRYPQAHMILTKKLSTICAKGEWCHQTTTEDGIEKSFKARLTVVLFLQIIEIRIPV